MLERNIFILCHYLSKMTYLWKTADKCKSGKQFNPIVYNLFRQVMHKWNTGELCLLERDILISHSFSVMKYADSGWRCLRKWGTWIVIFGDQLSTQLETKVSPQARMFPKSTTAHTTERFVVLKLGLKIFYIIRCLLSNVHWKLTEAT